VRALPGCGPCLVPACTRDRVAPAGTYCSPHQQRWWKLRQTEPDTDEHLWRLVTAPVTRGGEVNLRALHPVVVAELLLGLQERTRAGRKLFHEHWQLAVNDLRRQRVSTIRAADTATFGMVQRSLVHSLIDHVRRAFLDPETERVKDEWDLSVFGADGHARFTPISQRWLREAAKRWALEDIARRRGRKLGAGLRQRIRALVRLSQSLRTRPDAGEVPAALGRADIETFLHRLAWQQSAGQITADTRRRVCQDLKTILARVRGAGLTRSGQPATGLGEDFVLTVGDIPDAAEKEPGRDLPPEIMRQLCAHLDELERASSIETRVAIELAMDTGRRPEEICDLPFDCLGRDSDGKPVLVYDNDKANRLSRRLPIAEATAAVINRQQQRVRTRYPDTPVAELKLLPSRMHNQQGREGGDVGSLAHRHRMWVLAMPVLRTADGTEFDKDRIVPYAYRHTYAQRHADAGVGIDVLRELMEHRDYNSTRKYYRVGEKRRREAVDRLTALQFDRHGNRIWITAKNLLDSEHARRAVGEVVVPFGVCAEPTNVAAGGQACPYRFRCVGCDHFRTDVSYLPDLRAHLDDLLRNRERLRAATDVEDWARAEATPSEEEITRMRRLISRVEAGLDALTAADRAQIDDAIAVTRRHRTTMLGMPRIRQPLPDVRPEQTA